MAEENKSEESNVEEATVKIIPVLSNVKTDPVQNNAEENNNKDLSSNNTQEENSNTDLPANTIPEENSARATTSVNDADGSSEIQVTDINDEIHHIIKKIVDFGTKDFYESLSFNEENQNDVSRLQELIQKLDKILLSRQKNLVSKKPKRDSEQFRSAYCELVESFESWKTCREKLLGFMRSSPSMLQRISRFVSGFRIFTSLADIAGTCAQSFGTESWYSNFAMENASLCALVAVFLEQVYVEKLKYEIKTIYGKDIKLLKKVDECFHQLKMLDDDIKRLFPKGVNDDIVKKLNKSNFDDATKLLLAIVFSNEVDDDETLQGSKDLVTKARGVSTSDAKIWLKKVIFANDPYAHHCLNSKLGRKIQENMEKMSSQSNEKVKSKQTCSEVGCRVSWEGKLKILLNAITILLSLKNILSEEESEIPRNFQIIAKDGEQQLEEIKKIVLALKPPDMETDVM